MNLSPTDIAIRNLIASRMNISNPLILNVLLASTDQSEFDSIRALIDAMLSGPAGVLTGVLSSTYQEECHCRHGRIAAYRTIQGAQLFPIGSPNEDFTEGFNAAVGIIKSLAGQLADELDTDGDDGDGSDDDDGGDDGDGGDQPVNALEIFGRLFGDHIRHVAASR